jgi:hypothetical protein
MRKETITYEVYKFHELSETAKTKALDDHRYVEVSDEYWYEHITDELKDVGIEVPEFDTYRSICKIKNTESWQIVAERILKNYGATSEYHILAHIFLPQYIKLIDEHERLQDFPENVDIDWYEVESLEVKINELEQEFERDLAHEILKELRSSYEYCTSDECIIEFFETSDYEFHADGRVY